MSGPSRFRQLAARVFLGAACAVPLLAGACGGPRPAGLTPAPESSTVEETLNDLFNLTGLYRRLGRVAAGPPVPFVGQVVYLAGRGDSTIALLGLSLDNRALSFQRTPRDFTARYRVEMTFQRAGATPIRFVREEAVTVGSFEETQRVDETVVFQQAFLLEPGSYTSTVVVREPLSGQFSRAEAPLTVPGFAAGSFTAPIMVYRATARRDLWAEPAVILNPRGTVAHGDDSMAVYVEAYGLQGPERLPLEVRDEQGNVVYAGEVGFQGGRAVEAWTGTVTTTTPALGRLALRVGPPGATKETTALVSFSRTWVLTNYDNLLDLLRYFGRDDDLNRLRRASPEERPALWRAFWKSSDPNPDTPENEALDRYLTRVAIANQRFRDEGGQEGGWRTDRGEVYIVLGEPDQVYESQPGAEQRYVQWVYNEYRAQLIFAGQLGFSRLRLVPESRAEFARARALAQQRQRRAG